MTHFRWLYLTPPWIMSCEQTFHVSNGRTNEIVRWNVFTSLAFFSSALHGLFAFRKFLFAADVWGSWTERPSRAINSPRRAPSISMTNSTSSQIKLEAFTYAINTETKRKPFSLHRQRSPSNTRCVLIASFARELTKYGNNAAWPNNIELFLSLKQRR